MKECPACHRCFPDHLNHCPSDGDLLKFILHGDTVLDGRYQLESKLGQGGMGMVFKARHVFLKTPHAVKVILPDLVGNDPSLTTRFRQEAMAAAAIRHPNTISVTDYGIINGTTPFLVMEFVEGRSLHELLLAEKRLRPARAVELMLAVCAGVSAAHRLGIVHRDLKPLNILIRPDLPPQEAVKVLDFGLAKIKSGELLGSFVAAQTQGMMGSPFYMAPEQWADEDIDVRADIYSLGVILYQALAGDVPFRGASIPAIMNKHLTIAPAPLSERGVEVSEAVERAVAHALEKDPGRRPQTVEELMGELREALSTLNGGAGTVALGAQTTPISPGGETFAAMPLQGAETGGGREDWAALKTVAGDAAPAGDSEATAVAAPEAEPFAAPRADSPHTAGHFERGADTAHQHAERTSFEQPADEEHARPTTGPDGAGLTTTTTANVVSEPVEDARPAEQERERARQEEEQRRFEAEARAQREAKERIQREAESARRPAAAPALQAAPATQAAAVSAKTPSRAPLLALAAVVLLALLGGGGALGYFLYKRAASGDSANANASSNANAGTPPVASATRPDLVPLPGGTFRMGRNDVPSLTEEAQRERPVYLLWMYNQWPAHEVSVKPFAVDRTEVTNAEYAAFVKETNHPAPPDVWDGNSPRAGEESFPVRNVTYEDALAFAAWRSKRDGVTYRLPTEDEWEYAARGGDSSRLYPWGAQPAGGRANFGGAPKPVGSIPDGRTPQGVEDMLGNVWEWTSSEARMYAGNGRTRLSPDDRDKVVIRGGAYETSDDEPVTVTSRRWVAKEFRSPLLGFRLVRGAAANDPNRPPA